MTVRSVVENDLGSPPVGVHFPDGTAVLREVLHRTEELCEAGGEAEGWPAGYFEETAGVLQSEPFDRPEQGQTSETASW